MNSMKSNNITIISDSVSMPRAEESSEKILISHTWPTLLNKLYNCRTNIYNFSKRARDSFTFSNDLINEAVKLIEPQFIILQVGIVDCSPRLFSNYEKRIIFSRFFPKSIRKYLISYKKNKFSNTKNINKYKVKVDEKDFNFKITSFINNIKTINKDIKIIIIPIIGDLEKLEEFRTGYIRNIKNYNKLLDIKSENTVYLSDIFNEMNSNWFYNDGYHLSKIGHEKIAKIIYNYLNV
jgi:acyl-CoA thioesterase I